MASNIIADGVALTEGGVFSMDEAIGACNGCPFGGSKVVGWERGVVDAAGGYEGGPRGASLV